MSLALVVDALRAELDELVERPTCRKSSRSELWNVVVVAALRRVLRTIAEARGMADAPTSGGRLFRSVPGFQADDRAAAREALLEQLPLLEVAPPQPSWSEQPLEAWGQLYELLLAARPADGAHSLRKRTGSYYTPQALTQVVVDRAFSALAPLVDQRLSTGSLRVLDPALGAGAFLVQAGREVARRSGRSLTQIVQRELFGIDVSPLAVAVAEASLWLLSGDPELELAAAGANLREGDALCSKAAAKGLGVGGVDFDELCGGPPSFDLVIGNPPWVAFAGRATQPLPPALRAYYRAKFRAFRGYPTLHALFVELGARLSPRGVLALLIPSPVSDLDGYRPTRGALAATHTVCEPLLELGQDAFEGVTQPCFALIAEPRREPAADPERAFVLSERRRAEASAVELRTPPALARLASLAPFPSDLFGEMGLQTNGVVTRQLLYRGPSPPDDFSYALLEGRDVVEFALRLPRLFLKPDRSVLAAQRCRLREASDYARVKLVVRQTAAITIAAAHDGTPFRNSLLAGFELPEFPRFLTLGLLNSTLYRALHLARRRDARQGAFPQVKVGHLRSLPSPPSAGRDVISTLAERASERGLTATLRRELDAAVYAAFGIAQHDRQEIDAFVRELSPRAGLIVAPTPDQA